MHSHDLSSSWTYSVYLHLRMCTHASARLHPRHPSLRLLCSSTQTQVLHKLTGSVHNGKQTVISRFQAASQFCSTLLLVYPRLWGGASAVGFNKSIVFGSCLKGLGFILECRCCRCCCFCGCGRREGYCAGTRGRLGSVSMQGPSKDWSLLFDSFNIQCVHACVCERERVCSADMHCKHMCKFMPS